MNKEETEKQKTILNVGYCETTKEILVISMILLQNLKKY